MKKRNLGFKILAAVLAMIFASCSKKSNAEFKIKLADTSGSALMQPLVAIAKADGILDKNSIDLSVSKIDRGAYAESVTVGKVDIIPYFTVLQLVGGGKGNDLIIFLGTMTGGTSVWTNKKNGESVRDIKNWKGKKIAAVLQSTGEMVARSALDREFGWEEGDGKDYKIQYFSDTSEPLTSCAKGETDICFAFPEAREIAESQGLVYLYPLSQVEKDYVCCRQAANGTFFRNNTEAIKAYIKSNIEAYKVYHFEEEKVVPMMAKMSNQEEEYIRSHWYDKELSQDVEYLPDPNYNGTYGYYKALIKAGLLETTRPLDDFFDIDLYAQTLKEVIAENPGDSFYESMWDYFIEHNNLYPDFEKKYGSL